MKLLAELYSEDFLKKFGKNPFPKEFEIIKSVRGVVKNPNGQVALAYYGKYDFHSLIGGGVEPGESEEDAIIREVNEETGFNSKIIDEIGIIFEYKKSRTGEDSLNISYCYILEIFGESTGIKMTDHEKEIGFGLRWLSETEALKALSDDMIETEKRGQKRERDYLFLSHS